jgi:quercetin dioxygenase-like cupin family protein
MMKLKSKKILTSFSAALALGLVVLATQTSVISAQSSNFQGGSPQVTQAPDMTSIRILFPAGVRSSWHTHSWGQLLMIEEGIGLHQVRGRIIEEIYPGEPWFTGPDIEHWHGAHPDVDAHQLTIYEGTVDWLDPVTDEQYTGLRQRL